MKSRESWRHHRRLTGICALRRATRERRRRIVVADLDEACGRKPVKRIEERRRPRRFCEIGCACSKDARKMLALRSSKYGRLDILHNTPHRSRRARLSRLTRQNDGTLYRNRSACV